MMCKVLGMLMVLGLLAATDTVGAQQFREAGRGGCSLEGLGMLSAMRSPSAAVPVCVSPNWTGELARYYSFTLRRAADVQIAMTSSEIGTWVGLREVADIGGRLLAQGSANPRDTAGLTVSLNAGAYTVEAASPEEGVATAGPFALTVSVSGAAGEAITPLPGGGVVAATGGGGASSSQRPRDGEVFTDCDVCPRMVAVPGGTFRMGTNQESYEQPIHNVRILRFAIGVEEVTTDDIEAWYQETRGRGAPPCNNQERRGAAAACLSWYDAKAYVAWLSRKTGQRYRLLTEAEWEYVAQRPYDFGVYDMIGNVWEWVEDCWHDSYRGAPTDGSAWTGGADCRRVVRGGTWRYNAGYRRPGARDWSHAGDRDDDDGFRVARTLD